MNDSIQGKKLLILAGELHLVSLVERARELGVYTIVTDYYDTIHSPAKLAADEYWNVSWTDLDTLERLCREKGVNGITTGYSEYPVEACIRLCQRLGLPCYCNMEQLLLTRDKAAFKTVCRKYGVPVVREYLSAEAVDSFPVIVKPVDRAGSIGVGVASDREELERVAAEALDASYEKKVIIEDFISDGAKFDVIYAIRDGKPVLLSDCDTVNSEKNGTQRVIQNGWLFPSRCHDAYVRQVHPVVCDMIRGLQIRDGYIFFSGFAIERHGGTEFVFFETGFRLSGGHMYRYMCERGGVNVLDIFIYHALTGNTRGVRWEKETRPNLKCAMVNYYAAEGTVASITGTDKILTMPDCTLLLQSGRIGDHCDAKKAILKKMAMVHFCNESPQALADDVAEANRLYGVFDADGRDMIYDRIEPSTVAGWWRRNGVEDEGND